jgi:hypothetical protein
MNEPFDRGDINEASLAATERLRARLMAQPVATPPAQRSVMPWVLAAALFAFAAGLIANPWFEQAVRGRLPFIPAPSIGTDADTAALAVRLQALEARTREAAPVVAAERLAATEARVDSSTGQIERDAQRIDALTAQIGQLAARLAVEEARDTALIAAIQGTADRAEAMLTVLLMRRAIDAGRPLDAFLPAIRRLFEARHADAVAAVAALSADPVTRAGLARDLAGMAETSRANARPNWWQALMTRVEAAFSGASVGSPAVQAAAAMTRGDLAAAVALLRADPAAGADPQMRAWLRAADRLTRAEAALAELESAAADTTQVAAVVPAPAVAATRQATRPRVR